MDELAKEPVRPGIAERLREASRIEFSQRGFHGARVQGISKRAGCNVALLYRHWTSKKALYLDVLRTAWTRLSQVVAEQLGSRSGSPAVVAAYLEANMRDPVSAQIMVREMLDGGPFLAQLVEAEPALVGTFQAAVRAVAGAAQGHPGLRPEVDPTVAVLAIAGLAALVGSAHSSARALAGEVLPLETWRRQVDQLLLHGLIG